MSGFLARMALALAICVGGAVLCATGIWWVTIPAFVVSVALVAKVLLGVTL